MYPPVKSSYSERCPEKQGFALVIAFGLMAFVLLLLLTISTLVQVEQASSTITVKQLEAEQAALLSLNLAIGKLQETAGLDQRVTAPAEAAGRTEVGAKQLTGVWRSWEGRDHESNGLPIEPDYASKLVTGDQEIDIAASGSERFLGWLVSGAYDPTVTDASTLPDIVENAGITVPLVSAGTVGTGSEEREVHVTPTALVDGNAAIAWWVSGENTKAFLQVPENSSGVIDWSARLSSSLQSDPTVFDITDTDQQDKLGRVPNRLSLNLLSNRDATDPTVTTVSGEYFHDLAGYARGLLTNTATGGWRKDLSLLSEGWDALDPVSYPDGLPFFTLQPGIETSASKVSSQPQGLIYPWSESYYISELANGDVDSKTYRAPVASWDALLNYVGCYKKVKGGGSPAATYFETKRNGTDPADNIPVHLLAARVTWILGFHAKQTSAADVDPVRYEARLVVKPVVTMWNPYNVAVEVKEDYRTIFYARNTTFTEHPVNFRFTVGTVKSNPLTLSQILLAKIGADNQTITIDTNNSTSSKIWKPGETRVYSMAGDTLQVYSGSAPNITLTPGLRIDSGYSTKLIHSRLGSKNNYFGGTSNDPFLAELILNKTQDSSGRIRIASQASDSAFINEYPGQYTNYFTTTRGSEIAATWGDQVITNDDETLKTAAENDSPFLVLSWGLRMANTVGDDPDPDNVSVDTKGIFEGNPLVYASQAGKDSSDYPFEWHYLPVNDWGDQNMPQSDDSLSGGGVDEAGFIGTGFRSDDGLARMSLYELPTRPLQSLGELQHFHLSYPNMTSPFALNPIGNSHAYSQIAPDEVMQAGVGANVARVLPYDHSYVANHLLFDDWFVSSITPEVGEWSNTETRTLEAVYSDFKSQQQSLANSAYLPSNVLSETAADADAADMVADDMAWRNVAAEIEVEGMFNVNSTSVPAWKAHLRNALNGNVPELEITEASWNVNEATGDGQPVSRTTIAGPSNSAGNFANDVATHKRLSESQLELLAAAIVEQIKQRGPFLSLAEFLNRRLLDNPDPELKKLAKAGVIEAALLELSEAADSPYSDIKASYGDASIINARAFPEAVEEGNVVYGYPGWIRQADILRPIAPILSARDDTFVIRAYGESKDPITGKTGASAWCEAVVQRRADYVDPVDDATVLPSDATLSSEANKRFGRRFTIVSFRWLAPDEV